jgi:hypothetical protein
LIKKIILVKNTIQILAVLISVQVALNSCGFAYGLVTGIRSPRVESYTWQRDYLSKHGIDTQFLASFKTPFLDSLVGSRFALDTMLNAGFSPVQFRVYDGKGNFYSAWELCFGSGKRLDLYNGFPKRSLGYWPINPRLSLQNDQLLLSPLNFDSTLLDTAIQSGQYDYIVLSFWAGYLGKHSRVMLTSIDAAIKRNNTKKFLHIKVNLGE